MIQIARGRLFGAALFLALPAMADPVLEVHLDTDVLVRWSMTEGREACLTWNHSVTGGKVADCFARSGEDLVLRRSYLHDFAAGLGEIAGRGTLVPAAGGGYWIEEINEPIADNALTLRIGAAAVDHQLHLDGQMLPLSNIAPHQRARIILSFSTQ